MTSSVDELLDQVVTRWRAVGPLTEILGIVEEVWRTNLDRHEPSRLGDDAMSLGIQCSRNIMNRCVRLFRDRSSEFLVHGGLTLEVNFSGHIMHVSKVQTQSPSWSPYTIDWNASDVRIDGARINAAAYSPTQGTLLDGAEASLFGLTGNPGSLTHLHLAWQGLADGDVRVFIGFPTTGQVPWSAVMLVHDSRPVGDGIPRVDPEASAASFHDALAEPTLPPMRRRAEPRQAGGSRDSA